MFEEHLKQPIRVHNIRKRMQKDVSSNTIDVVNGAQVSVNSNGDKVDPIKTYAHSYHVYAEGPDFLLSDTILYPLYILLMAR